MPQMFEDFLTGDIIPIEKPHLEDDVEQLFIHSHENLIEKTLGDEECMMVQKQNIVGFTDKIQFEPKSKTFVSVKGPGILYIETSSDVQRQG